MNRFSTHDVIAVDPNRFCARHDAPAWVARALDAAPWVVVRRLAEPHGIAVGVRGADRAERFAGVIDATDALAVRRPEDLRERRPGSPLDDACARVRRAAASLGLRFGPTGAYGFELATGLPSTHATSDLDIVVRADGVAGDALLAFHDRCATIRMRTGVTVDVEAEFGPLGIALAELSRRPARVIAKTPNGPALVACPT